MWKAWSPPQPSSTKPPVPSGRKAKSRAMSQLYQYTLVEIVIGVPYECSPPHPSSTAPDWGEFAPGSGLAARAIDQPYQYALGVTRGLLSAWMPPHPSN